MTKIINVDGTNLRIEKIDKPIELSVDQTNALNTIKEWLYREIKCPDDCFFRLTGSAGTGKTTLLSKLVQDLQGIYKFKTCVSAPTHKAKLVIERFTGREGFTIHKLLALSPNIQIMELDFNDLQFLIPSSTSAFPKDSILICDEASMVNDHLFDLIYLLCIPMITINPTITSIKMTTIYNFYYIQWFRLALDVQTSENQTWSICLKSE